jgi:Putative abortive phage resistance protein AbiGi, antitoxin
MEERYFYHSFPRRGKNEIQENEKGLKILKSICDFGLLLTPEVSEYKYEHANETPPRVEQILQKRICFTELSSKELKLHSENFGHFSIEFEIDILKKMGAIPVFYIPLSLNSDENGVSIGSVLLIQFVDTLNLIRRLNTINGLPEQGALRAKLPFKIDYPQNPAISRTFEIDTVESSNLLKAVNHGLTPLPTLVNALEGILGFFYPADNRRVSKGLEYYRQREWKICLNLTFAGKPGILRPISESERKELLLIDQTFFSKKLIFQNTEIDFLKECFVLWEFENKHPIELAKRVIVPNEVKESAKKILSVFENPPIVISFEDL